MNAYSTDMIADTHHVPLPDLARQLAADGLALVQAEARLARTRLAPKVGIARVALILIGGAAIIAFLAAIGLLVGLVIALSGLIGPFYAGLVVGGAGFATAGALGALGAHLISNLLKPLMETFR